MGLKTELENQGAWLFRWRGYLPLLGGPVVLAAFASARWPFGSQRLHEYWDLSCFAVSLLGLAIRIHVVGHAPSGTSGRNTTQQQASSLNTTGMYSVVRHPLYLGNYLIAFGATLVPFVWWLPVLFTAVFWLYYERIMFAEEAFLRRTFGGAFNEWADRTRAFVPKVSGWQAPTTEFSLRFVLRKEYTGLAVLVGLHAMAEAASHVVVDRRLELGPAWIGVLVMGMAAYVILWSLKRHTSYLDVPDR